MRFESGGHFSCMFNQVLHSYLLLDIQHECQDGECKRLALAQDPQDPKNKFSAQRRFVSPRGKEDRDRGGRRRGRK